MSDSKLEEISLSKWFVCLGTNLGVNVVTLSVTPQSMALGVDDDNVTD